MSQGVTKYRLPTPCRELQTVELQGFPATFHVVTTPTSESELGDICWECNILEFACQIKGGLNEKTIVGLYNHGPTARAVAKDLLEKRG